MTSVGIIGWGCCVPQHWVGQMEAAEYLLAEAPPNVRRHQDRWRRIFKQSGIKKRHTLVTRAILEAWRQCEGCALGSCLFMMGLERWGTTMCPRWQLCQTLEPGQRLVTACVHMPKWLCNSLNQPPSKPYPDPVLPQRQ